MTDHSASDTRIEIEPMPLFNRIVTLIVIILPMAALVYGIVMLWNRGFEWLHLVLLVSMYLATGIGVTIGFHRLFTHRAFETSRVVQAILGVLGSMAVEGSIFGWVADHRRHHQHSDRPDDPHSPHQHGEGILNMLRGFWKSHIGWLFDHQTTRARYIKDLSQDRFVRTLSNLFPLWVLLSLLIPMGIAGLVSGTWTGALLGLVWGGLVRIMLVHHITWSINSVCHIWGTRPFKSNDQSRNNALFGILGFGEGWHNNHHAFPTSARHGLRWWEIDASWIIIWTMAKVGLVWNVRVPPLHRIEAKRR
jgi:stearoyl-CoA desaturase (delta-9 desaturase)